VAENDSLYAHIAEGSDGMPSHIEVGLTATRPSIPIAEGRPSRTGRMAGRSLVGESPFGFARRLLVHVGP
jgi:hypothetical protein